MQNKTGFFAITIWPVKGEAITQYAIEDESFEMPEFEKIRDFFARYNVYKSRGQPT